MVKQEKSPKLSDFSSFVHRTSYLFLTPWYSSMVFVVMVVAFLVLSDTCVYVAVVEIVRHALHEVMPKARLIATTDMNKSFLIFVLLSV